MTTFSDQNMNISRQKHTRKIWIRVLWVLSVITVFCTTYALIIPAITWERSLLCEIPEHQHGEACYDIVTIPAESRLICGTKEHRHGEECFNEAGELTCPAEEHSHTDACCEVIEEHTERVLVCRLEEHVHNDACFDAPPADDKEYYCNKAEHSHSEEQNCYFPDGSLRCTIPEHQHTLACKSDPTADTETPYMWENTFAAVEMTGFLPDDVIAIAKTQIGYTESTRNYEVREDGETVRGYTRYGDRYGDPYADWSALFCRFCLDYAGAENYPFEADAGSWTELLSYDAMEPDKPVYYHENGTYVPKPGDLIFLTGDPDGRVGFVEEIGYDPETDEPIRIVTIEGDFENAVSENVYDLTEDNGILGYAEVPEDANDVPERIPAPASDAKVEDEEEVEAETEVESEAETEVEAEVDIEAISEVEIESEAETEVIRDELPEESEPVPVMTIESAPAADGAVAVIRGDLPEMAEAVIEAVSLSEEELAAYFGEDRASAMTSFVAYDIKILVNGEEWQPDDSVSITVEHPDIDTATDGLAVAHIRSSDNAVESLPSQTEDDGSICFSTDGFSVYVFYLFTVDYYYGDTEYHQPGMSTVALSDLFEALKIDIGTENVSDVEFSRPDLLQAEYADGNWTLTSLEAFHSAETLTVRFFDGSEITLNVFDAATVLLTENGPFELASTVTDVETLLEKFDIRNRLASYGITATTTIKEVTISNPSTTLSAAASGGKGTVTCTAGFTGTRTVRVVFNAQQGGDDIACEFTNVSAYVFDMGKLWDYSGGANGANSPKVIVGSFDKSIVSVSSGTKNWSSSTTQTDKNNAPIGYSGRVITSKGGTLLNPIVIDGQNYYLYVATNTSSGDFDHTTKQSTPFPCVYGQIPVVAWIEDGSGNKVTLDNVCVGNEYASTRWYWKFGGSGRQLIFANNNVTWSGNAYGTAVANSSGSFQGIMPDDNGYYFFSIAKYSINNGTGSNYDEISVFKFDSSLQVKKTVRNESGTAITGGDTQFNFVIEYTPWSSDTPVTEEFTLVNGGTYEVEGVPGTNVKVWEVVDPLYTTTVKNGSASETSNLTTETITLKNGQTVSAVRLTTVPQISASSSVTTITFFNRKKAHTTITKTFTGLTAEQIGALADTFAITATTSDAVYQLTLDPDAGGGYVVPTSVTNGGMTYTWEVPDGTRYTIAESGASVSGYNCDMTLTSSNGTVNGNVVTFTSSRQNKAMQIANSYEQATVPLTVTKTITGPSPDLDAKFPVRIKVTKGDHTAADLDPSAVESSSVTDITFSESVTGSGRYDTVEFKIAHGGSFTIPVEIGSAVEITETSHAGYRVSVTAAGGEGAGALSVTSHTDSLTIPSMPAFAAEAEIVNTAGELMPATGGHGARPYYIIGGSLIAGCLLYARLRRKKKIG